jgi:lysylphosphatidylglycerol synthetase-like protein (DUF2156 family)
MSDLLTWDPGWFPDPTGRHDHRWWDGAAWTAHVADAGVAGHDALDAPGTGTGTGTAPRAPGAHGPAPVGTGPTDPVAVIALTVAILAVLLALLPIIGLVPAFGALVLAVVARSRIRRSGRRGDGVAIAGLVTAIAALLIAVLVTIVAVAVLGGSGGELSEAFREYAACLESNSQAECRSLLEQSLARIVG